MPTKLKKRMRWEAKARFKDSVAESKRLEENFVSVIRASEQAKLEAERLVAKAKEALKRAEQLVLATKKAEELFKKSLKDVEISNYMLKSL